MRRRALKCLCPHTLNGWKALHEAHVRDYLEKPYWTAIENEEPWLADLASGIFWTCLEGVGHFGKSSPLILAKNRLHLLKILAAGAP
jgi:hypothetical protein